jgi:hypothetical protein
MEKGKGTKPRTKKTTPKTETEELIEIVPTVETPEIITPEAPKDLHYTRLVPDKVSVQYTSLSSREGQVVEIDYGLAVVLRNQGKVRFI